MPSVPPRGHARPAKNSFKIIPEGFGHGHEHEEGGYDHAVAANHVAPPPSIVEFGHGDGHGDGHTNEHSDVPDQQHDKFRLVISVLFCGEKRPLLNYILQDQREKKLAVIEQVDEKIQEKLVTLDNGCTWCTMREGLVKSVESIAKSSRNRGRLQLDGFAFQLREARDLAPAAQAMLSDSGMMQNFYIDSIAALVDVQGDFGEDGVTTCAQIALSSTVLLTSVGSVPVEQFAKFEARIKELNSSACITRCDQDRVEMSRLINVRAFSLDQELTELVLGLSKLAI